MLHPRRYVQRLRDRCIGVLVAGVEDMQPARELRPQLPPCGRRLLLPLSYLLFTLVVTVASALMPAMATELRFSSVSGANVVAAQSVGLMCGKLLWGGWPVDSWGATRTYALTMVVLGAVTAAYQLAGSAAAIALLAGAADFVGTPSFAAHVQWVRGWWGEAVRADGFWLLGVASRGGDVIANLVRATPRPAPCRPKLQPQERGSVWESHLLFNTMTYPVARVSHQVEGRGGLTG
eukprot:SAG25_NODE_1293_length_3372_cov_1.915063_1_plen_235_part_00